MKRDEYQEYLRGLLSQDPMKVRDANRKLYAATVLANDKTDERSERIQADIALAELA